MKTIIFTCLVCLSFAAGKAQTLDRYAVGSTGKTIGTSANASIDYTVGELAITSVTGSTFTLPPVPYGITQGFQQGIFTRAIARTATGEFQELDNKAIEAQNNSDALSGFRINVFPNPTTEAVNVELLGEISGKTSFTVTNLKGQEIHSGNLSDISNKLDLSKSEPGVYILQLRNQENKFDRTFRIVKQ